MSSQLEQSSQGSPQFRLRRAHFFPFTYDFEKQSTMIVPTANGEKHHEDVPTSPLFELTQQKIRSLELQDQFLKAETCNLDTYSDPAFEKYATLPMIVLKGVSSSDSMFEKYATLPVMVLKGVSSQQSLQAPIMQSEISGAAGNAAIVSIGNFAGYVLKSGSTFLIQRGLQARLFGLYSLSLSVVTLIGSILTLGLDDAMVRYVAIYQGKKQANLLRSLTVFCSALAGVAGILGALLLIYFAPSLATFYHRPALVRYLRIMAPLIPLLCMQVIWMGGLQGFKEFKKRVLSQRILVPIITGLLLVIALIFFRGNVTAFALVTLIGTLISVLLNLYFLFGSVSRASELAHEEYNIREWLGFAVPNFLTNIVDIVLDAIDTLLLAIFSIPIVAIGLYVAAIKVTGFIGLPLASLNIMFAPTIAELHSKGEKQKLEAMFKIVTRWSITFSLPIFGITILFSKSLLEVLSGSSFVAAWPLLIAFAVGGMINAGTGSVGYMLLMTGHQKISFLNSFAAVIVNIVLGVILTPRYGAMGTAISTGLAMGTVNLMRVLQVRLLLKMQPYARATLKPLGAGLISALLTGVLLYLLSFSNLSIHLFHIQLSIQLSLVPVFLASYIGLLALFKISPEDEIVLNKLRKKFGSGKKRG